MGDQDELKVNMKAQGTLRQIPSGVWMLGLVSMFMDISSEMIHSLLPLFMVTSLGASAFSVGLIEGLAESTALVSKVFSGVLSDYFGKRKALTLFGYSLGACSKPLFGIASSTGLVLMARFIDRLGKGIRGAPRDAIVSEITPAHLRGAAFGLRQGLDTVGAFIGPLLGVGFMVLWDNNFRAIFWLAAIPGFAAVLLLFFGVQEPETLKHTKSTNPLRRENLVSLSKDYWWVVVIGAFFSLARFSEAFLVLRAQQVGVPMALVPLVMVLMNLVYAVGAYPFGKLADQVSPTKLLVFGICVLVAADLFLAASRTGHFWESGFLLGIVLWGLHMAVTQGLLAKMVADTSPAHLRGTAYGFFNLVSGMALLLASLVAGLLWDQLGSGFTFYTGTAFSLLTLFVLMGHDRRSKLDSLH
jgi:MFS family permease